jgi:hypothetical protein
MGKSLTLVLLLTTCAATAAPDQDRNASLRIAVLDAETGLGLAGASLWIIRQDVQEEGRSLKVDEDGTLTLRELKPGSYSIHASSSTHLSHAPRRAHLVASPPPPPPATANVVVFTDDPGTAMVNLDGAETPTIVFRLKRGAAIAGTAIGPEGAVVGARVTLLRDADFTAGPHTGISRVRDVTTDGAGAFAFTGLHGASYRLAAYPAPGDGGRYNDVYFPSTTEIEESELISVADGEHRFAPIRVRRVPKVTVSGRVIDEGPGARELLMERLDDETGDVRARIIVPLARDLRFSASGTKSALQGLIYERRAPDGSLLAGAFQVLHVGDTPISGLRLKATPPASMSGRFVFQGTAPAQSGEDDDALSVSPWPVGLDAPLRDGLVRSSRTPEYRFDIANLIGAYRVHVHTPPGWLPLAILLDDGRDIADTDFEAVPGKRYENVRVVLTDQVATVRGTVADFDPTRPGADLMVTAFSVEPAEAMREAQWRISAHVERDGRFTLRNVRPGREYFIAACSWPCSIRGGQRGYAKLAERATRLYIDRGGVYEVTVRH